MPDELMTVSLGRDEWYPVLCVSEPWGDSDGDWELPVALVERWKAAEAELDAAAAAILAFVGKDIRSV